MPEGKPGTPGSFCTARFPHSPFICQSMQVGPDRARLRMRRLCSVVCGPACPRDTWLVKISLEQLSHVICGHSCQIKHPAQWRVKPCMQLSVWINDVLVLCHSKARRGLDAGIPWNETRVFHELQFSIIKRPSRYQHVRLKAAWSIIEKSNLLLSDSAVPRIQDSG